MREIVLDTETTGFDPLTGDRIIEIGCVELSNHVRTGSYYQTYLNPERLIPEASQKVHGISDDMVENAPKFRDVVDDFLKYIGNDPLIIHNAPFDLAFLNYELELIGREPINNEIVDTLLMARKEYPGAGNSLDDLCRRYSISLEGREKHGALIDVELLADVYLEMKGGQQGTFLDEISFDARYLQSGSRFFDAMRRSNMKGGNLDGVLSIFDENNQFKPTPRIKPTDEELEQHKNFIKMLAEKSEDKTTVWATTGLLEQN